MNMLLWWVPLIPYLNFCLVHKMSWLWCWWNVILYKYLNSSINSLFWQRWQLSHMMIFFYIGFMSYCYSYQSRFRHQFRNAYIRVKLWVWFIILIHFWIWIFIDGSRFLSPWFFLLLSLVLWNDLEVHSYSTSEPSDSTYDKTIYSLSLLDILIYSFTLCFLIDGMFLWVALWWTYIFHPLF